MWSLGLRYFMWRSYIELCGYFGAAKEVLLTELIDYRFFLSGMITGGNSRGALTSSSAQKSFYKRELSNWFRNVPSDWICKGGFITGIETYLRSISSLGLSFSPSILSLSLDSYSSYFFFRCFWIFKTSWISFLMVSLSSFVIILKNSISSSLGLFSTFPSLSWYSISEIGLSLCLIYMASSSWFDF